MKRAGHLLSKMRFVSAQLDAYISNDVWLKNAKHANAMGKKLSQGLQQHKNVELAYPTDANEIFVKIPKNIIDQLNSHGYKINDDEWEGKAVRLVAAWNTDPTDVESFLNIIKS
jgi:threonine aldolase